MLDVQQEEYLPIWRETSEPGGGSWGGRTAARGACPRLGARSRGCRLQHRPAGLSLPPADETSFEAGIRVQIHSQEEPPYIHQLGFGVSPGFQTFVSCQEQRVRLGRSLSSPLARVSGRSAGQAGVGGQSWLGGSEEGRAT